MTKDQHLEDQEQQYRESADKSIARDAAVFVQQGFSRDEALAKSRLRQSSGCIGVYRQARVHG